MTTKQKILTEALRQFNEKGLHQVGVREIARSLQISPGNMSYHFPKKEDLLLEILKNYSSKNQTFRIEYQKQTPSLLGFLGLFRDLFSNQYEHRGIFAELVEVNRVLARQTGFDYNEGQENRIAELSAMISDLQKVGKLQLGMVEKEHLVSFLTLFGRFWISEAFLRHPKPDDEEAINHYLQILKQQLWLQATDLGRQELALPEI
jgi:AcrR family transcriptional regulator